MSDTAVNSNSVDQLHRFDYPENLERIIDSDEAQRLRQEIGKAINNYASLFERQGYDVRELSKDQISGVCWIRTYEIETTIAVRLL